MSGSDNDIDARAYICNIFFEANNLTNTLLGSFNNFNYLLTNQDYLAHKYIISDKIVLRKDNNILNTCARRMDKKYASFISL